MINDDVIFGQLRRQVLQTLSPKVMVCTVLEHRNVHPTTRIQISSHTQLIHHFDILRNILDGIETD